MNNDMISKAKEAKNVEELLSLAKSNHIVMTEEKAQELFKQLHAEGELSDNELDDVAGGGCGGVKPKYNVGEIVAVKDSCKCYYCGVSRVFRVNESYIWTTKGFTYDLSCIDCDRGASDVPESDIIGRIS